MSAWFHHGSAEAPHIGEALGKKCRFCRLDLQIQEIKDRWPDISPSLGTFHEETMRSFIEVHGDFLLEDIEPLYAPDVLPPKLGVCPFCGWWAVWKDIYIDTKHQYWYIEYGASATLRSLDSFDITAPATEVRQYLTAKYQDRYEVNPRHFEEVVASVFASCGYSVELTAYSSDGGVDAIIRDPAGSSTAIQVKRYKNTVEVAEVRELLGAMVLGGHTKGIFVTTSRFSAGANEAVDIAAGKGISIELVDSTAFLKKLHVAQVRDSDEYISTLVHNVMGDVTLQLGVEYHLNSL